MGLYGPGYSIVATHSPIAKGTLYIEHVDLYSAT